jgi:hypothetical protein
VVDAVADRVGGTPSVIVDLDTQARLALRVFLHCRDSGVVRRVDDHDDFGVDGDRLEDPIEAGDDVVTFVVCGDDDRRAWGGGH